MHLLGESGAMPNQLAINGAKMREAEKAIITAHKQVRTVCQIWQPAAKLDRIRAQFRQVWQSLPNLVPVRRLITSSKDKLYVGLGSTGIGFACSV